MKATLRVTMEYRGGARVRLPDIDRDVAGGFALIGSGDIIDGLVIEGCGALRVVDRRFLLRHGQSDPESITLECVAFRRDSPDDCGGG